MTGNKVYPVILAGGGGVRLARFQPPPSVPKQFQNFQKDRTFLAQTVRRFQSTHFHTPFIVTVAAYRERMRKILSQPGASVLFEPFRRNTAAAVAFAAFHLLKTSGPQALMTVCPSDHWIGDEAALQNAIIAQAQAAIRSPETLYLLGVRALAPSTAYGYIVAESLPDTDTIHAVDYFVEKPDVTTARTLTENPLALWNCGIITETAEAFANAIKTCRPDIWMATREAYHNGRSMAGEFFADAGEYENMPAVSFDRAVLESYPYLGMSLLPTQWMDIGTAETLAMARALAAHNAADDHAGKGAAGF